MNLLTLGGSKGLRSKGSDRLGVASDLRRSQSHLASMGAVFSTILSESSRGAQGGTPRSLAPRAPRLRLKLKLQRVLVRSRNLRRLRRLGEPPIDESSSTRQIAMRGVADGADISEESTARRPWSSRVSQAVSGLARVAASKSRFAVRLAAGERPVWERSPSTAEQI